MTDAAPISFPQPTVSLDESGREVFAFDANAVEQLLRILLQTRRMVRGDKFATAAEMDMILADPWGWMQMVGFELGAAFQRAGKTIWDMDVSHRQGLFTVTYRDA